MGAVGHFAQYLCGAAIGDGALLFLTRATRHHGCCGEYSSTESFDEATAGEVVIVVFIHSYRFD